jgi:hypothetical protein
MRTLALLALAGYGVAGAAPAPTELPAGKRFEQDMMVRLHMHENFGLIRQIERLLVHGKLDAARELARAMAEAPDEPGLAPFAVQATRVRERAAAMAAAKSTDAALRAEARVAEACASCHVDAGVRADVASPATPPLDRPTIEARMARHLWASQRLWEAMLGDDDAAWRDGLDVLAATPLPAVATGERAPLAKQLQRQAVDSRRHLELADRATAYGELLVTCAGCHAKH